MLDWSELLMWRQHISKVAGSSPVIPRVKYMEKEPIDATADSPLVGVNPPTLVEWVQALESHREDVLRLAPHQIQILEFLEDFVASDPPRRLIICDPPSRLPLRRQD